ncbi:cytochrome C oxidase subunit II [Paenibacillus darwinianus]|uniref:Quinol oxidase subunit 2 n=1 Tax=Paenibacillus darwinianus TaxID=1380763 RepID=A0A9W5W7S7_9BACL|nr:ubiquinol oxidase subunit II [Paenibacillus darwinianus]EXX88869.1 cytochrome C oxidase subunit II [Paenibacillus darwinianus]EXX89124.1 cytochrome C oxidase subunit II [Paenibacillus darwinianus]EXX90456.1 cytochrome C oxidase subunit II [Paenibacillus darwinianus]
MKETPAFKRVAAIFAVIGLGLITSGCANLIVLDPKGPIGEQQKDLIWFTIIIALLVFIPVMALTAFIVWRYRDKPGNKAPYIPDWEHNTKLEAIWWGVPILIIIVLAVVTVRYTYALEPSKPLGSKEETLTVQVASLDWKWLFLYPEQGIASVNYLQIPEDVPVKFELTSDAPMNSFWIPQLGGQVYTMSGMAMTLHLQADEPGVYMGSGANFSGAQFGQMKFDAKATSQAEFDEWVASVKQTSPSLTAQGYQKLAQPGVSEVLSFSSFPEKLFQKIVNKYVESEKKDGAEPSKNAEGPSPDVKQSGTSHANH